MDNGLVHVLSLWLVGSWREDSAPRRNSCNNKITRLSSRCGWEAAIGRGNRDNGSSRQEIQFRRWIMPGIQIQFDTCYYFLRDLHQDYTARKFGIHLLSHLRGESRFEDDERKYTDFSVYSINKKKNSSEKL